MTKPRNDRPLAKARRRLTRLEKHPPKPTSAAILPGVAAARAKDWDQVTTYTVHFVNGKPYGPGVVRAHPDVVDTIRDQMGYRRRHHLDPVTALPEPSSRPDAILPIRATGVGAGEVMSPWAQQCLSEQAAEVYVALLQRERQPEPSDWGDQSPRCSHAGSGPCLQCGGFERSPSRAQTRRHSIFGETLA